jgi:hypothetical protein
VGLCHIVFHPEGDVLMNNTEKFLSLNQTSSPRLEPRTVFGFVTLVPVIVSPKNKQFCFFAVLSCLFSELLKLSSSGLEPRTVFGFVT